MIKIADGDLLPYAPRIDTAPYGCDAGVAAHLVTEQTNYLGNLLEREILVLPPAALEHNLGDVTTVHASDLQIDPSINSVVISRRHAYETDSQRCGGLCAFSEDGVGNGSLVWVNMQPRGIKTEFDLGVIEARLAHELWHSIGLGHCAVSGCLMYPELSMEEQYGLSKLPSKGLCRSHRIAIDGIARDQLYFTRLRRHM